MDLKKMREKIKKTQAQVAEEVGVSTSLVAMWETGQRRPYNHADVLAKIYGTSIEKIFLASKATKSDRTPA